MDLTNKICPKCGGNSLSKGYYLNTYHCQNCGHGENIT